MSLQLERKVAHLETIVLALARRVAALEKEREPIKRITWHEHREEA